LIRCFLRMLPPFRYFFAAFDYQPLPRHIIFAIDIRLFLRFSFHFRQRWCFRDVSAF
jgi:hypothetical protein